MDSINYADLYPPEPQRPRRIRCDKCGKHLYLRFEDFNKIVSGIRMRVLGLPMLHCLDCMLSFYPDKTRISLIKLWEAASEKEKKTVIVNRQKIDEQFPFCKVKFIYDPDDYYYIPGLFRQHSPGFLTPVFFNKAVLSKYDSNDKYQLQLGSATYGTVKGDDFYFCFGINPSGKVIIWLGDLDTLPEEEQHYLRSENISSDHKIGSEFYDAQIECVFTEPAAESALIEARSQFLSASLKFFGKALSHLDAETLTAIDELTAPLVSSPREQKRLYDIINKVTVEAINSSSLKELLAARKVEYSNLKGLKQLQKLLEYEFPAENIADILCPFYVTYDFRVATSHLISDEKASETKAFCLKRLGLPDETTFDTTFNTLVTRTSSSYQKLTALISSKG